VDVVYAVKQDRYVVTISDNGVGIPKESLPHIFEPFYRAGNSIAATCSGLGLSIVRSHITFHGGKIYIESEVGKWTKVTVTLPIFSV
jgi:signal transduction histidine kinase